MNKQPLTIAEQGSFFVGGTVIQADGTYSTENPMSHAGQTFHGDHAYVSYQIPVNARRLPLVFLHGAGQSGKTWESTPDGREGFGTLFLRRGFATYLLDQPRRGRAGNSTIADNAPVLPNDQFWFENFRMGSFPNLFADGQFPKDAASLNQFLRQITPNTGAYDLDVVSDAVAAVFDRIGEGVLITHSQGGGPGWQTVLKNPEKVKAVVSYEPGTEFVFPEDDLPIVATSANDAANISLSQSISAERFALLTKMPIVIYFGDNIRDKPSDVQGEDQWRIRLALARQWADVVNRHGGDATVVHLPDAGIRGNTHFPMADLNNVEVADHLASWLHTKKLDR